MTLKSFIGGLLLTSGWLGTIFSGGCTLFFAVEVSRSPSPQSYIHLSDVLLIGGIPFIVFVLLILLGRYILKSAKQADSDS